MTALLDVENISTLSLTLTLASRQFGQASGQHLDEQCVILSAQRLILRSLGRCLSVARNEHVNDFLFSDPNFAFDVVPMLSVFSAADAAPDEQIPGSIFNAAAAAAMDAAPPTLLHAHCIKCQSATRATW